jgi:hypothetical protein
MSKQRTLTQFTCDVGSKGNNVDIFFSMTWIEDFLSRLIEGATISLTRALPS